MNWRSMPQSNVARRVAFWTGWAVVIYVVAFWRLGFPSFWDPDEAVYAVATRGMLRTGDWLAPMYNGAPFFDKPILFYWLQLISFKLFGATEWAARLVPAVSGVGVIGITGWAGRVFFNRTVGTLAALFLAVLPATFALSAYAILDMTFTAFLFAGVVLATSAVLHGRPGRQWWGYVCIGLAVLTKGPLAIVLAGLSFVLTLAIAPRLRSKLLSLHWIWGVVVVLSISSPWFIYMWLRFGYAFIEGYFLRENIWLYASQLFTTTRSPAFYFRVAGLGLLPWTPLLIGRLVDALRGDRISDEERLFWAWSAAITIFFTCSRFKLDHYIYPVLPALCLLAAHTWWRVSRATALRPLAGATVGAVSVAGIFIAAGLGLFRQIDALPLELAATIKLAPAAMIVCGVICLFRFYLNRWRPPTVPVFTIAAMLVAYGVVLDVGLDAFERAKPIKDLASWVSLNAPEHATITAYQLDRWKTSWRFYADRHLETAETPDELLKVLHQPGTHYAVMSRENLDAVRQAAPQEKFQIVRERRGLSNTSGRGLRKKREDWPTFVVVTHATADEPAAVPDPRAPATPADRRELPRPSLSNAVAVRSRAPLRRPDR